jgi:acetylornithine deacetylase/succinyl-diaminopimelate desuccinylase-like protein
MKGMVAMEVAIGRLLAALARAAGRDPAGDPIPGLRRDVLFAATADEEAGGWQGAGWIVEQRPEWLRAPVRSRVRRVSVELGGRRFCDQTAEGLRRLSRTVHGTWGHGSVPRPDNAAVRAAAVVSAVAEPEPARPTPVIERFIGAVADELGGPTGDLVRRILDDDPAVSDAALRRVCEPALSRAAQALLRDTISPNVIAAGVKYNVIPGVAEVLLDCRTLPGTSEAGLRDRIVERLGEELTACCDIEAVNMGSPVETPAEGDLYASWSRRRRARPEAVPLPIMVPFATDAKHTAKLGVPTSASARPARPDRILPRAVPWG